MPTHYRKIEDSSEVMDVVYALVLGINTPKEIAEKLGKGSNVRSKLQFLRKNKVVVKDKWKYDINWDGVSRKMTDATKQIISSYSKLADNTNKKRLQEINVNIKSYFPKTLLMGILKLYAVAYFEGGYDKTSLKEMMQTFLSQLPNAKDEDILRMNKKLMELKEVMKKQFFFSNLLKSG